MLRQMQKSTLFPYTTLFRSWNKQEPGRLVIAHGLPVLPTLRAGAHVDGFVELHLQQIGAIPRRSGLWIKDRKSTRLNSSHPSISYAVFCLKKKTNGVHLAVV